MAFYNSIISFIQADALRVYDLTFLVLFSIGVGLFLWKKRKNLKREGIMYLYRTRIGIELIDYIGKKYKKKIRVFGFLAVVCGYGLMALMIYFLYSLIKVYLFSPEIVRAIKIPPLMPLIPYLPSLFKVNFLPPFYFTYWILAIGIIAIFHEFAHGIVARRYGVKIKTTGFGFLWFTSVFFIRLYNWAAKRFKLEREKTLGISLILTLIIMSIIGGLLWFFYSSTIAFAILVLLLIPFLAAFVEPDEKQMQKRSKFQQISILSAGVFTNLLLSILFFLLLAGFFVLTYHPAGAMFNSYTPGIINISAITVIGGVNITSSFSISLLDIIDKNKLTNDLSLRVNEGILNLTKIRAGDKNYFIDIDTLKSQLKQDQGIVVLYEDFPAINNALGKINNNRLGVIIVEINGNKIKDHESLSNILNSLSPGDKINLVTKDDDGYLEYEIKLGESPNQQGKAVIGLGYITAQKESILGRVFNFFNFFKEPSTYYEPRFNPDFVLFIYNLIWWIALINLSVALVNMWPVAIFDGGRMFMLTIWGITGSEKFAQIAFKIITYIILASLLVLMFGWFVAIF